MYHSLSVILERLVFNAVFFIQQALKIGKRKFFDLHVFWKIMDFEYIKNRSLNDLWNLDFLVYAVIHALNSL